ncbi:hypothetical protein QR680_008980 [Steinernema hermaphroditum]|uniref:Grh/CP2 DB domain-containing protein n=1 Tax=Steinernema hermaphroditum TaxID=289476 RepID=A0AA39M819_9BILA|nr:hypothetical protein QR680_008980 [Steinernema hermaphroditum]
MFVPMETTSSEAQPQSEAHSVIRMAPPGDRQQQIDFEQQQQSLQELNAMQQLNYSYPTGYQEYTLAVGTPTLLQTSAPPPIYYQAMVPVNTSNSDWSRPLEHYGGYPTASTIHYIQQQTADGYGSTQGAELVANGVESTVLGGDLALLATAAPTIVASEASVVVPKRESESPDKAHSVRASPVVIPKVYNALGFQYILDAPISTSIRIDEDRITYVNKDQFYGINLSYIPDPVKPIKSLTVKSQVMVVFGDNKSFADEMGTWREWQRRQTGGGPPRILGIEPKNCTGIVGPIDSIAMNGVQFYWNTEQGAKLSVAVHCLSTEFSLQKGVKGLPMNIQVDTYDENISETVPFHRGYCQIKIFCDKGAERKLRDEYRRQQKRKAMNRPRKSDFEYHEPCDKSEFYHMSDLEKPAALYPGNAEDLDSLRRTSMSMDTMEMKPRPVDRVVIYGKRREDAVFTPIVITPPSVVSLAHAVAERLGVSADKVVSVFKHCRKGATVRFDDDMIRFYCSGDIYILELGRSAEDPNGFALNLYEQVDPNARSTYQGPKSETAN